MYAHRALGFLAAVLVTVAQIAVFATDTAAVAQTASARGGYENGLDTSANPQASVAYGESGKSGASIAG
jgi:hypothetical protein